MPILSELKAVNVSRPKHLPPILMHRNKLIAGAHKQFEGIKAKLKGEDYVTKPDNQKVGRQWFQLLFSNDYLP